MVVDLVRIFTPSLSNLVPFNAYLVFFHKYNSNFSVSKNRNPKVYINARLKYWTKNRKKPSCDEIRNNPSQISTKTFEMEIDYFLPKH